MSWVVESAFSIHNSSASYMYDKYVCVGNDDFDIRVWNTETSSLYRRLPPDRSKYAGHENKISGFAYSQKYDLLFSCGYDGYIIIWHGTIPVYKYQYHSNKKTRFPTPIYSIYFCEDADILCVGLSGEIVLFELSPTIMSQLIANNGKPLFTLRQVIKAHNDIVHSIHGFQKKIFTASFDHAVAVIQIADISVHKIVCKLSAVPSAIYVHQESQTLVVGDLSGSVRSYSIDGLPLGVLFNKIEGGAHSLFYDQAMNLVWVVSKEGAVYIIDPKSGGTNLIDSFQFFNNLPIAGSTRRFYHVVMGNESHSRMACIVNHKYIYSWKYDNSTYTLKLNCKNQATCFGVFDYNEDDLISHDKENSEKEEKKTEPQRKIYSPIVSPGVNLFVGGTDIVCYKPLSYFIYLPDQLYNSPDANVIEMNYKELCVIVGFTNGSLLACYFTELKYENEYHSSRSPVSYIYCHESLAITISGEERSMVIWNVSGGLKRISKRDQIHNDLVTASAYSNQELFTCDEKGYIRYWKLVDNEMQEQMLIDHSQLGAITFCAVSSDDSVLVCSSVDGMIRGWQKSDLTSSPMFVFSVSPCFITCLVSGPDNDILVATDDKTIRLIALYTHEEKAVYTGHTDLVTSIKVPPGERWFSLQWDGTLFVWSKHTQAKTYLQSIAESHSNSSKLPKLSGKSNDKHTVSSSPNANPSNQSNEQHISIYERNRKTLLLKRRDQERAVRAERRNPQYHRILQLTNQVQKVLTDMDHEKRKRSASTFS